MNRKEMRRDRLKLLLKDVFKTQVALANAINVPDNYVSRMKSGLKGIGEDTARKIEAAANKPRGWLDGEEARGVAEPRSFYGVQASIEEVQLGQEWGKLQEPLRTQVRIMIETLVAAKIKGERASKRKSKSKRTHHVEAPGRPQ